VDSRAVGAVGMALCMAAIAFALFGVGLGLFVARPAS